MTSQTPYSEREQWFIDRIGAKVYRNKTTCPCKICAMVYENGLYITDQQHAVYLFELELEYANEGKPLKYFDQKHEAIESEKPHS